MFSELYGQKWTADQSLPYVLVAHPIPALVRPLCCYNNLLCSGKAFPRFWSMAVDKQSCLLEFSHSEIQHVFPEHLTIIGNPIMNIS